MRLFVAIELDLRLRRELASAVERLGVPRQWLKVVAPEKLHLTLRFVGEVDEESAAQVVEATRAAAAAAAPFAVGVRGLGGFPRDDRASVLWAGVDDSAPLRELAARVESELVARGFAPEPRGFAAHVTLARSKGRPVRPRAPLDREAPRFGEQAVGEVVVMESRASPAGSAYVPFATVALRP
jgi:2'-5' RNA ligase